MKSRALPLLAWLVVVACAASFVVWSAGRRAARLREVSALGASVRPDPKSPTGYAGGLRHLLVPELQQGSFQWLMQAQDADARGETRVRHVKYDNAPPGRETHLATPYRWWLQFVAGFESVANGRPGAAGWELAALRAGPALHLLLLVLTTGVVAWRCGFFAGGLAALGLAFLPLLAGAFLPGHPDDTGLKIAVTLWSVLLLGSAGDPSSPGTKRAWWLAGGIIAGFGLWLNVATQLAVIGGILVGGSWLAATRSATGLPWRAWATAGAVTSTAGWLVEYAPGQLGGLNLAANHPLFAVAWLAAAECLLRLERVRVGASTAPARDRGLIVITALVALAPFIAVAIQPGSAFPAAAAHVNQLTILGAGVTAESLGAWLARDGFGALAWVTLAPLLVLVPAGLQLWRKRNGAIASPGVSLAAGPVVVVTILGCLQLHWWGVAAATVVALAVALASGMRSIGAQAGWAAAALAILLPGLALLRPPPANADEVSAPEVEALVARDLAHWLARRAPEDGAIVLAPPALTASLVYYGAGRGIMTPWWENQEGFAAGVRIAGSTSADEALALVQRRQITHVVLPSWDDALEQYARLGAADFNQTLVGLLKQWLPPRWLRPVPYQLPGIAGLEGREVRVFEVVEAQDNPTALGRLAEYFLETGQPQLAAAVSATLKQAFPQELAALAARAHVDFARRDGAALNATLAAIDTALGQGADEILPWDRRVSLALALAQARRMDQARTMMANLLEGADDERLRSLTPGALYRAMQFNKAAGIDFPDPAQHERARALLPAEWRDQL